MKTLVDKLRMAEWLLIAVVLLAILAYTAPQQIPVFVYKANLVAFFGFMGYWLDRRLFWYSRCGHEPEPYAEALLQSRRALIVAATMIAGAIAL